jgi:hypothetical protein
VGWRRGGDGAQGVKAAAGATRSSTNICSDMKLLTLFELDDSTCRWPVEVGNGVTKFCGRQGANLRAGRPYCAQCTRGLAARVIARRPPLGPTTEGMKRIVNIITCLRARLG